MPRPNISLKSISLTIVLALFYSTPSGLAQDSPANAFFDAVAQAEAKMTAREWSEAALLWEKIVRMNPVEGRFWEQLALAYYNAKDYRKSIPAYEKVIELGYATPAIAAYNIACNYALLGEKEQALKWLEKAFEMNFLNLQHARADSDLESLRSDPRYQKLVALV